MDSCQNGITDSSHYSLENKSLIGIGSKGNRVYKVTNTIDNQVYALKKVIINPKDMERYTNELSILKKVNHPNIIKYHESFTNKDKLYIVMECATGGDLKSAINAQISKDYEYFPESLVVMWFSQVVDAIHYLHSMNILHRDIKPQNVFLTSENNLKLGDFGVSKELESSNDYAQSEVGTPFYLSPEICRGEKYNFKTDIWTLGCLLYEICALEKPFISDAINVLISKIITNEPKPLKNKIYSQEISNLIFDMLKKNPDERPEINEIKIRIGFLSSLLEKPSSENKLDTVADTKENLLEISEGVITRDHSTQSLPSINRGLMISTPSKHEERLKLLRIPLPAHKKSATSYNELTKAMKKYEINPVSGIPLNSIESISLNTENSTPTNEKIIGTTPQNHSKRQLIPTDNTRRKISSNTFEKNNDNTKREKKSSSSLHSQQAPINHQLAKATDAKRSGVLVKYSTNKSLSPTHRLSEENKSEVKKIPMTPSSKADGELRHNLVNQFLVDRYGKEKFDTMMKMLEECDQESLVSKVTDLLGKDEGKIASNYLKYLARK